MGGSLDFAKSTTRAPAVAYVQTSTRNRINCGSWRIGWLVSGQGLWVVGPDNWREVVERSRLALGSAREVDLVVRNWPMRSLAVFAWELLKYFSVLFATVPSVEKNESEPKRPGSTVMWRRGRGRSAELTKVFAPSTVYVYSVQAQRYVCNPCLWEGSFKYHLRVYALLLATGEVCVYRKAFAHVVSGRGGQRGGHTSSDRMGMLHYRWLRHNGKVPHHATRGKPSDAGLLSCTMEYINANLTQQTACVWRQIVCERRPTSRSARTTPRPRVTTTRCTPASPPYPLSYTIVPFV